MIQRAAPRVREGEALRVPQRRGESAVRTRAGTARRARGGGRHRAAHARLGVPLLPAADVLRQLPPTRPRPTRPAHAHAMKHGTQPGGLTAPARPRRSNARSHAPACLRRDKVTVTRRPKLAETRSGPPGPTTHRRGDRSSTARIAPREPSAPRSARPGAPGPPESFALGRPPRGAH